MTEIKSLWHQDVLKKISVLRNALNVVCIEIEEWEFETRLGNYLEDLKILLYSLNSVIEKMEKNDTPID